jgi:hypothetical protein
LKLVCQCVITTIAFSHHHPQNNNTVISSIAFPPLAVIWWQCRQAKNRPNYRYQYIRRIRGENIVFDNVATEKKESGMEQQSELERASAHGKS